MPLPTPILIPIRFPFPQVVVVFAGGVVVEEHDAVATVVQV